MALKKKSGGGGGANWMDTYGDMVTLLLCFFVLLYSMSTISEDKWKAIVQSFNPSAVEDPRATAGAEGPNADDFGSSGQMPVEDIEEMQKQVEQDMQELLQQIQEFVQQQNLQDAITVSQDGGKIFITFSQSVFFDGESAVVRKEAYPILDSVSEMLSSVAGSLDEVRIQGHTARARQTPNNVQNDRTLSSDRATNVVIYIQQHSSVPASCLVSEGFGEWRPIERNDTAEGRAKNRRVEMIISGRDIEAEVEEHGGIQQYIVLTS